MPQFKEQPKLKTQFDLILNSFNKEHSFAYFFFFEKESFEQKIPILLKRVKTCENYEDLLHYLEQVLGYSQQDKLKLVSFTFFLFTF